MKLQIKRFDELSSKEIYEILRARATVFVKEKGMTCVDPDGRDCDCLHAFFMNDGVIAAYLRAEKYENGVKIGRVLTVQRGMGLGRRLLEESIPAICEAFRTRRLIVHAQIESAGFYERLGFTRTSGIYIEEEVPHVTMEKEA